MRDRIHRVLIACTIGLLIAAVMNRLNAEFTRLTIAPHPTVVDLIVGFVSGLCAFAWVSLLAERAAYQVVVEKIREEGIVRERTRIACDIHDVVAQCFVGIIGDVEAAQEFLGDSPQARAFLERTRRIAREGLVETRSLVRGLRSRIQVEEDLRGAVTDLAETLTEGTQLRVNCSVDEVSSLLSPATEMQILRIIREALTNVIKHANADQVWVTLSRTRDQIQLCIEDNGGGFAPGNALDRETFGLCSMRERARQLGGLLWIYTQLGQGTQVAAVIPNSCSVNEGVGLCKTPGQFGSLSQTIIQSFARD
ncbi:MAG TPA: sensor histidine kinase [Candidatus Acidoferrales bacterium]|nr:sensor histidine kinase [Candidatus Acidoferrales bacterium]